MGVAGNKSHGMWCDSMPMGTTKEKQPRLSNAYQKETKPMALPATRCCYVFRMFPACFAPPLGWHIKKGKIHSDVPIKGYHHSLSLSSTNTRFNWIQFGIIKWWLLKIGVLINHPSLSIYNSNKPTKCLLAAQHAEQARSWRHNLRCYHRSLRWNRIILILRVPVVESPAIIITSHINDSINNISMISIFFFKI